MDQSERNDRFKHLRSRVRGLLKQCAADSLIGLVDQQSILPSAPQQAAEDAPTEIPGEAKKDAPLDRNRSVTAAHVLNAMLDYLADKVQASPIGVEGGQPLEVRYGLRPDLGFTQWPSNFPYKAGSDVVLVGKSPAGGLRGPVTIPLPQNGEVFMRVMEKFLATGEAPPADVIEGHRPMLAESAGLLSDQFALDLQRKVEDARTLRELSTLYDSYQEEWHLAMTSTDHGVYDRYKSGADVIEENASARIRAGINAAATIDELLTWKSCYTSLAHRAITGGENSAKFEFQSGARAEALDAAFTERVVPILRSDIERASSFDDIDILDTAYADLGYLKDMRTRELLSEIICHKAMQLACDAADANTGDAARLEDIGRRLSDFPFPTSYLPIAERESAAHGISFSPHPENTMTNI